VVLSGHEHIYERFAPQTPAGAADPARGLRQFIVGTGGRGLYAIGTPKPNSEVRNNTTFGVLKLTLGSGSYAWQFVPVAGAGFTDSGTGSCH
jgi:acid phosphatase type 7